jgi:hypothetical protein
MSEPQKRKPVNYEDLFPGRFMNGAHLADRTSANFLGDTPTFTIADYDTEDMPQDKGGDKTCGIITFREIKLQLKLNSTNGQCFKAMFGKKLSVWPGKRVTFCSEKDRDPSGGGMVDTVRVLGSPDISHDMTIEVKLPRRKPRQRTLKRTGNGNASQQQGEQKPNGDIEDAIARLTNAPLSEVEAIAEELRGFRWRTTEREQIATTLDQLRAKMADADGRE